MEQPTAPLPQSLGDGLSIPDHELLRCIGQGSYGQVWLARNIMGAYRAVKFVWRESFRNEDPFQRELKGIRKFEPISRSHPGFVNILHVGQDGARGYFYCVMELGDQLGHGPAIQPDTYKVKTLDTLLRNVGHLPVDDVLSLGLRLSEALQHLHASGLVHRDIKPSNIIFVGGLPKLADIGLVTEEQHAHSIVGTLGFIPPEGPGRHQADIFALGKVLYECLTGLDRNSFPDMPGFLGGHPERDRFLELNEIIIKSCYPDARSRYQTARQLHAELAAVENGASVLRLRELERKWARFTKWSRAVLVTGLLGGAVAFFVARELRHFEQERQRNVGSLLVSGTRAIEEGDYAEGLRDTAQMIPLLRAKAEERINRLRYGIVLGQVPKMTLLLSLGADVNKCEFNADGTRLLVALADGHCQVRDAQSGNVQVEFVGHSNDVFAATFSGDGRLAATGGWDRTARIWDTRTGQQRARLAHPRGVQSIHFHPDGQRIVTGCGDGIVRVWDWASGTLIHRLSLHGRQVNCVRFSHGGGMILSTGSDGRAQLWDAATGRPLGEPIRHSQSVLDGAFSPDDRVLVTGGEDQTAHVWSLEGRALVPALRHERAVRAVGFSPDGTYVITGGWDDRVQMWTAAKGARVDPILKQSSPLMAVSFSPDGRRLVTGCTDGTLRVWDFAGRTFPEAVQLPMASVDGTHFLSTNEHSVEVYAAGKRDVPQARIVLDEPLLQTFSSDNGTCVTTISADQTGTALSSLRVWDATTGRPLAGPIPLHHAISRCSFDRSGRLMAWSETNQLSVLDLNTGLDKFPPLLLKGSVRNHMFSPSADRLAILSGKEVTVIETSRGTPVFGPLVHERDVSRVLFSADSSLVLTCTSDQAIRWCYAQVWNGHTGEPAGTKLWHRDGIKDAAWILDGRTVVLVDEDGSGKIWDVLTGRQRGQEFRQRNQIVDVDVASDLILSASWDGTARLWDAATGLPVGPPLDFEYALQAARFVRHGDQFIAQEVGGKFWWVLPLASVERSAAFLRKLSYLLNGRPEAQGGVNQFQSAALLAETWRELKTEAPECFSVTKADIVAWHRSKAWFCRMARSESGERMHLDYLLRINPTDELALRERQRLEQAGKPSSIP